MAAKAAIACRADDAALDECVEANEDPLEDSAELAAKVRRTGKLRTVDRTLYSAVVDCVDGDRREMVVDGVCTEVPFGSGCLALRLLDRKFGGAGKRALVAATAELLQLAPGGKGAADMDAFLSRFRVLVATAGRHNAGPAVQTDVLQRAALGHAVLGRVVMAWRQAGSANPAELREKLEDAEAEGMADVRVARGMAAA